MKTIALICLGLALTVPCWADQGPHQIAITKAFTNSVTLVQPQVVTLPAVTSVVVTFPDGSHANTLSISLVRDGITHKLVSFAYTGETVTWYTPNSLWLLKDDQLVIANTATQGAVLICNESY